LVEKISRKRNIDHVIVAVRDLDAAAAQYRKMGFAVSPKMHQSIGLSNHLMMFQDTFLELLGGFDNIDSDPRYGPIAKMKELLDVQEGAVGLAFFSDDAAVDFDALTGQNVVMSPVASFKRPVPLPDGSKGEVLCSVTMSAYPRAPALNFFLSHQHRPHFVWIPEWQIQPNGSRNISSLSYVADTPADHRALCESFVGNPPTSTLSDCLSFETERSQTIEFITSSLAEERYGRTAWSVDEIGDRLICVQVTVDDIAELAKLIKGADIPHLRIGDRTIRLMPAETHGIVLDFSQSIADSSSIPSTDDGRFDQLLPPINS